MSTISDPAVAAIFQPDSEKPPRALLVAGACGNVGFGKLGQFARLMGKYGVPVYALDLSPEVQNVPAKLRKAFGPKFSSEQIDGILSNVHVVQGTLDDLPSDLEIGFVFEAIPERLDIKRPFYEALRKRDKDPAHPAYIFSATSGLTTQKLFKGIEGSEYCGVLHPFFPHLTNKLWELPDRDCVTSKSTLKALNKLYGRLGMNVISVRDVPAFAADRIFCGMMLEAVRIHDELGLSPAQVDDACKKLLGTSPFFVHNLIPGSNYLSAHCMELCHEEIESTLFRVPEAWKPYLSDPKKQWPYERGEKCPKDMLPKVRQRMLGMLTALTAYMVRHDIANPSVLNFLCENALAFRAGVPAVLSELGRNEAASLCKSFLEECQITKADEVAPLEALSDDSLGWDELYVSTAVHNGVGLISLKRRTISHVFIAELDAAYERLAADESVTAMVLAPDGKLSREFGHGADPNAFLPVLGNYDAALGLIQKWKATLGKLRRGKPTVAALVGRVLGGGLELASNCHARVAGAKTVLGQPEPTVGVVPGLGGCHHIHRFSEASAHGRINELLLTGHSFGVEEAEGWGFISKIVAIPELPQASMAFAAGLGSGAIEHPAFRDEGIKLEVNRDVDPRNEAGVVHDADLRDLIARTVEDANAATASAGSEIEEQRAAESLASAAAGIGVKALARGKAPEFPKPLV